MFLQQYLCLNRGSCCLFFFYCLPGECLPWSLTQLIFFCHQMLTPTTLLFVLHTHTHTHSLWGTQQGLFLISHPCGKNVPNSVLLEKRHICVSPFLCLYMCVSSTCLSASICICVCVSGGVRSRQGLSRAKESKSVSSPWADNPSDPHSKTYWFSSTPNRGGCVCACVCMCAWESAQVLNIASLLHPSLCIPRALFLSLVK